MRILFVGDVVGRSGRTAVAEHLPEMIRNWSLDLVVVNGENAAGGFGITEAIYQEFVDAGADAVTLGNHSWDQREALVFIERAPRLVRPANFPPGTPGRGAALIDTKSGKRALVINAIGEADSATAALDGALAVMAETTAPVINPPAAILKTGRVAIARRLEGVPGVRTAKTMLLPAAAEHIS